MNIGDAILAKQGHCPTCQARPNVACRADGRQRLTLMETHEDRLTAVQEGSGTSGNG